MTWNIILALILIYIALSSIGCLFGYSRRKTNWNQYCIEYSLWNSPVEIERIDKLNFKYKLTGLTHSDHIKYILCRCQKCNSISWWYYCEKDIIWEHYCMGCGCYGTIGYETAECSEYIIKKYPKRKLITWDDMIKFKDLGCWQK